MLKFYSLPIYIAFFLTIPCTIHAIKLSLKQDLSVLMKQLSPKHIGQFLHSINDFSGLAAILDPDQKQYNFDFSVYYNIYGCSDIRIFNYTRIDAILLSFHRLTKKERLLLLNGECLANWPGMLKLDPFQMQRILQACPEANPLPFYLMKKTFVWDRLLKSPTWHTLLESAHQNRHLNHTFKDTITGLINIGLINQSAIPSNIFGLIGPETVKSSFSISYSKRNYRSTFKMVSEKLDLYSQFLPTDLFYWALNLGVCMDYALTSGKPPRYDLFTQHFNALIEACPNGSSGIKLFLKRFSHFILSKKLTRSTSSFLNICNIFESFQGEDFNNRALLLIELQNWFESNARFISQNAGSLKGTSLLIYDAIKGHVFPEPDKFLDFFLNSKSNSGKLNRSSFKKFIGLNYETDSSALLGSLRTISWSNHSWRLTLILKNFLTLPARLQYLKKSAFSHTDMSEAHASSGALHLFIDDGFLPFGKGFFSEFCSALLEQTSIFYPFEVKFSSAGLLGRLLGNKQEPVPIETVLQEFWINLLSYDNNFMFPSNEYDREDEETFPNSFIPCPWTNPNVLFAAGCVMTLALLHGVKLHGACLLKSVFVDIFENINLRPTDMFDSTTPEPGRFIGFPQLNLFSKSILLKQDNHENSLESIKIFLEASADFTSEFQERIFTYQCKFKFNEWIENRQVDINIWGGEEFLDYEGFYVPEDVAADDSETGSSTIMSDGEINDEGSNDSYGMEDDAGIIHESVPDTSEDADDENEDLETFINSNPPTSEAPLRAKLDMARLQIYSLYCGLHPAIRFLTANEAYEMLFKIEETSPIPEEETFYDDL
jgi:hypothetical protein